MAFWIGTGVGGAQTAATFHVFPQIADGASGDGTYYQSLLVATNAGDVQASCTLRLYGVPAIRVFGSTTFTIPASGAFTLLPTLGSFFPLATGYATLTCDRAVTSTLAYFYANSSSVLGAAAVFGSPPTRRAQLVADERAGSRLALAVANDTDTPGQYDVTLVSQSGQAGATAKLSVPARSSVARYMDEVVQVPANFLGGVRVTSTGGSFSLIGLNFVGSIFFTQPATLLDGGSTAPDR